MDKEKRKQYAREWYRQKVLKERGYVRVRASGRFSRLDYENSQERLESIKKLYRDGVPEGVVEAWINSL